MFYSSLGDNHGEYTVQLDNGTPIVMNGFHQPDLFNQSLWAVEKLEYQNHTITVTNLPTDSQHNAFDIEYISVKGCANPPSCLFPVITATYVLLSLIPGFSSDTLNLSNQSPPVPSGGTFSSDNSKVIGAILGSIFGVTALVLFLILRKHVMCHRQKSFRDEGCESRRASASFTFTSIIGGSHDHRSHSTGMGLWSTTMGRRFVGEEFNSSGVNDTITTPSVFLKSDTYPGLESQDESHYGRKSLEKTDSIDKYSLDGSSPLELKMPGPIPPAYNPKWGSPI